MSPVQIDLNLQHNIRYRRNLLNCFWDMWKKMYIQSLREKGWRNRRGCSIEPSVGDVVLLKEEKVPRLNWKIGTIVELRTGRDGFVRHAVVSVRSGLRFVRLCRPIRLLVPVESNCD
jgi:hypothetical protein